MHAEKCTGNVSNGSFYDPRNTGLIVAFLAVIVTFLWGQKTLAQYRYSQWSARMSRDGPKRMAAR